MPRVWKATGADAPDLVRLFAEFRDWNGSPEPSEDDLRGSIERLLRDANTVFLLAAEDDGEPTGVCQVRFRYGLWLTAEDAGLEDLFVSERARRGGLGRALVEAALEAARERGCRRIELDTNERNENAIALYESAGFSAWPGGALGRNLFLRARLDG
jgi:ribosomal protein S18 acetylase RimI-like enzyme